MPRTLLCRARKGKGPQLMRIHAALWKISVLATATVFAASGDRATARLHAASVRPSAPSVKAQRIPTVFEANRGQFDARVRFAVRGRHHAIFATDTGVTLAFERSTAERLALALTFVGASPRLHADGIEPTDGRVNYFTGHDSSKWRTNVETFQGVAYRRGSGGGVWPPRPPARGP